MPYGAIAIAVPLCHKLKASRACFGRNTYSFNEYYTTIRNNIAKNIPVRIDPKAIGRRIREIRGFDLTQGEFGEMLGVGQAQLSKYELGLSAPTLEVLLRLKAYSGKSIDWIVTGQDA